MPNRTAEVYMHSLPAGILTEIDGRYTFTYLPGYSGPPISLTMPVKNEPYEFQGFPPFFDGLLPEGIQLESLLRQRKIDKSDYFSQILAVGADVVGAVTIQPPKEGD